MSSSLDCSVQNGEEDMENKADKIKHKINQSEQKQEKNASKQYIGNLNPTIKEIDLPELFGLNTTKYLRETCSLNIPRNDKTEQPDGHAFVSAPKRVWRVAQTKWSKGLWFSNQVVKSTREQTIVVSSPVKNQPVPGNKNIEKQNLLQNLPLVPGKRT